MLRRLSIHNYALIDSVDLEFDEGFTAITGETGSGKSIMLGALSLVCGGRADSRVARNSKARVEAVFENVDLSLRPLLEEKGIEWISGGEDNEDCNEITIRREISPEGRSRVYINDTSVTLSTLSFIGPRLIDIHSQMTNSLLTDPVEQLRIIDSFTGNDQLLEEYHTAFSAFVKLRHRITSVKEEIEKNRANRDLLIFKKEQLDKLKPRKGELPEIERRYEMLSDAGEIKEELDNISMLLGNGEHGLVAGVDTLASRIDKFKFDLFGPQALENRIPERIEALRAEILDIAETMNDLNSSVDTDPTAIDKLSHRMKAYYDAMKHFGTTSADDLAVLHAELSSQINAIDTGGEELPALEKEARIKAAGLKKTATALTEQRKAGAETFGVRLLETARSLGLSNLRFEASLTIGKLGPSGQDKMAFLCAFNRNGEMLPIGDTASGGELSRLMLSLKAVMSKHLGTPTVIFDEIDTGVSGNIAERMGCMMRDISKGRQVIAITHLPQVASLGDEQFKVYKVDEADKTVTHVKRLNHKERVHEIAAMISGTTVTEAAERTASLLLDNAARQCE